MKKQNVLAAATIMAVMGLKAQTFNNVGTSYPGTPAPLNGTSSQLINSQDNQMMIQGNNVFGSDALRNDIKVGIGVFNSSPANFLADRLHLHDITATGIFTRWTNSSTGISGVDGLKIGIDGSGNALFKQHEALPMIFEVNTGEKMRITSSGDVGIGVSAPGAKLEIASGTSGVSGLKFFNFNNTSPLAGTATEVLSVDASGNVILVAPSTAGVSANNGLSLSSGVVQMGGNLIKSTDVGLNAYDIAFSDPGGGLFGIGGYVTTSNIGGGPIPAMGGHNAKIVFDNGSKVTTQKIYAYVPTGIGRTSTGLDIELKDQGTDVGMNYAIRSNLSAEGNNTGIFSSVISTTANNNDNIGIKSYVSNGKNQYGVFVESNQDPSYQAGSAGENLGTKSIAYHGHLTKGVYGVGQDGENNYGGYFDAEQINTDLTYNVNTGVYAQATYGPYNIGVDGYASGAARSANYSIGVYGHAKNGMGQTDTDLIGVKGECQSAGGSTLSTSTSFYLAGYFVGDVLVNGQGFYTGFTAILSDKKLKKNIKPMGTALDILGRLSPKTYELTNDNCKQLDFTKMKTQYGLIAQEVEEVIPDIVYDTKVPAKYDEKGNLLCERRDVKSVSYEQLISVLIKGTQEQQAQIADQQNQITEQQKQMDELKEQMKSLAEKMAQASQNSSKAGNTSPLTTRVDLGDEHIVVLEQNVPNPFFESTVIRYTLPLNYASAKMVFTTNEGKLIKEVDLAVISGNSLTVYAGSLSNGLYSYSMVVDGKTIDTKKMVKD